MAINCDPAALAQASACFECIPIGQQQPVQTYLLAQISAAVAGTSTDPNELAKQAACFACLQGVNQDVQLMLLCAIANASGA